MSKNINYFPKENSPTVYYLKNSAKFGWGEKKSLDRERQDLLDKYVYGKKVLDIGCGIGLYVDYLAKGGMDAYGVDFVDEFIISAKKTKKGTFIKGQAENLPFAQSQFDTVILFNILEHGDDLAILKEAIRIVRKRILVIVPKVVDETLEKSGVVFRHYLDKSHSKEYIEEDLRIFAKELNLKLIKLKKVHPLYNETIFAALFEGSLFFKKLIRKLVFAFLPKKIYPTEIFAVFEKR